MSIFDEMVDSYHPLNDAERESVQREVMQKVALAGLNRGGFFNHAAFYGGTCLRIFYGLKRFSEDMDFSLTEKNTRIHIENHFQAIVDEFRIVGLAVEIVKKDKKTFGSVESAFLKEDTEAYDIKFQTRKILKIKIELDTNPPLGFSTEQKLLMLPYSFPVRCFSLSDLYAGKMHALVYRTWQRRVKGRDWYDFEWYVRNRVPLDFNHLRERIREFNGKNISREEFVNVLRERLSNTDINHVKQDVIPYIRNARDVEIWSNDYFLKLADMIVFE